MQQQTELPNSTLQQISLPAVVTIETVEALTSAWLTDGAFSFADPLMLDAGAVEIMTTPGAQLILSLDRSLTQQGGSLVICQASDALHETFRQLGLEASFARWISGDTQPSAVPTNL